MRKYNQQTQQEREDKLRRDEHNGFVIEGKDKLVRDGIRNVEDIARKLRLINRRIGKRKLDKEEKEAKDLITNQLSNSGVSNSGAANLGNGKPQD